MTPSDVKIVAENINDFIEVPDGIDRLRKAMLTLAVSGQLVEQDESEGTAEELYARIQVEKGDVEKSSARKKSKDQLSSINEEFPFAIPDSWKWVQLGSICHVEMGQSPEGSEVSEEPIGLPFFQGKAEFGSISPTPKKWCKKPKKIAENGDVLISVRAPVGTTNIAREKSGIGRGLAAVRPYASMPNLFWRDVIEAFTYKLLEKATGTTFQAIRGTDLTTLLVPLPPLEEQKRIVEKVQLVMKQLDELESQKKECDLVRSRLTRSAMQALGFTDSKIAFDELTELIKTPQDIKELENAILTLAVSGNLAPQDEKEGTAEQLYAQIKAHRETQENTGGRKKKSKDFAPITSEEIPFVIPESWKWLRLGEVMTISSGDALKVKEATEGEYLVYGGNGIAGRHSSFNVKKGTIVIGRVGALCGIAHIVESDAWVTDNAFIVSYPEDCLNKDFFALTLNFLKLRSNHRGSAQPVISGISVYPILMPLPPYEEQMRIVKKVEELMLLVNELKNLIN